MAKFTTLEFMESLGLSYSDYNGAKILLRCLASKGIARQVSKIRPTGKGRPQLVYEIPEEITLSFPTPTSTPLHPPKKKKAPAETVQEETVETTVEHVVDETVEAPVAESQEYEWDEGWED